jgi:hypothetical protein
VNPEDIIPVSLLSLGGIVPLTLGLLIWTGRYKTWFIIPHIPVIAPVAFYNGSMVFMGASIISLLVAALIDSPILFFLTCFLFPSSIILAIWQPRWIKPTWYRWLEENHGHIIPILQKEAQLLRGPAWSRRVATQEGLEAWVEEVRRKRGL